MRFISTFFAAFYLFTTPLAADPNEDAKYIVSQTLSEEMFDGAIKVMTPYIASAIIGELQKKNMIVSDAEAFTKIIFEEFLIEFVQGMQKETITYYLKHFSSKQLADLAAFFKTETGQFYIQKTPDLMQFGTEAGQRMGASAVASVSSQIEKRLKDEGVIISKD